ncbi:MATE family efflux transporter [Rhodovulum sp. DZ06]|uniref:MATE family efflux transporter n=1 Tax=Rhodovulum sp. DZ06 TaxID=3425126 RepID=UPI003D328BB8
MTAPAAPLSQPPVAPPSGPLVGRVAAELASLGRLAWPVMLSRAAMLLLVSVDFAMAGRHSTAALGAISLGFSVFIPIMVAGVGLMLGVVSVAARQHGAEDRRGAAQTWARGMHLALAFGLLGWALCAGAETLLGWFGHAPELAASGGAAARALAPGIPAVLLFMASAFYLESAGRTMPVLAAMAAGNLLNFALNAAMIPGMGAEGAALASSLARLGMAVGLLLWVLRDAEIRALGRSAFQPWGPGGWRAAAEVRALGFAGGASGFFETVAFASLTQAAALHGTGALGAYSVAHSIEAMVFMTALGLATAAGVRVGSEVGRGRPGAAALAGWTGLGAAMGLTGAITATLWLVSGQVAAIYTEDPAVIARVTAAFGIVAISLVFDAGQAVMGQLVRALGDTWAGAGIFFFAFFCVMAPSGWWLALGAGMGEKGLFLGTLMGCATAVILLSWRFARLLERRRNA